MDAIEAIKRRRSIRKFKLRDVDFKKILEVLDCARWAPSAENMQSWEFVIVRDPKKKEELAEAAGQDFLKTVPWIIVACTNLDRARHKLGENARDFALLELGAAIENILVAAKALGLGTNFVGFFDKERVREIVKCPEDVEPVALIPIGVPAELPDMERLPLSAVIHMEEFGREVKNVPKEFSSKKRPFSILRLLIKG